MCFFKIFFQGSAENLLQVEFKNVLTQEGYGLGYFLTLCRFYLKEVYPYKSIEKY